MANAKKCDRCGGFYLKEEKKTCRNGSLVSGVSLRSFYGNPIDSYDLCECCTKKLLEFLEKSDKEE